MIKGLIHVKVGMNGKNTRAIVNRGPTHNFLSVEEAKTDGLKPNKERVCLKPVHSREKPYKVWLVRWSYTWVIGRAR